MTTYASGIGSSVQSVENLYTNMTIAKKTYSDIVNLMISKTNATYLRLED